MWNPRVGGEKCSALNFMPRRMGSPPHRPGKDIQCTNGKQAQRITPAWAGKRSKVKKYGLQIMDHPRAGGEKLMGRPRRSVGAGSPPHRRGKGHGCHQTAVVVGITPAWAGKRKEYGIGGHSHEDHPRVGGEKRALCRAESTVMGSPPRGRGKANWHCVRRPALRITPAQAGKRTRSWRAYGCPWDHPRVGGEKKGVRHWWALPRGSPPRGRGKVSRGRGKLKNVGITPAWAGKRSWAYINGILARDHPRVGGEKFFKTIIFGCSLGSPPRGRGKDPAHQRGRHRPGITPAWAGKRAILAGRKAQVEDHPRVGGEKHDHQ